MQVVHHISKHAFRLVSFVSSSWIINDLRNCDHMAADIFLSDKSFYNKRQFLCIIIKMMLLYFRHSFQ